MEPSLNKNTRGSILNILHLIDHYRIGGPGKTIINTYRFMDKKKFAIYVAAFVPSKNRETEFSTELKKKGIPFFRLKDSRGISFSGLMALKIYIQRNKIHFLHSHGYKADIIALILKRITPGLMIVTTHHGWIANTLWQDMIVRIDLFLTRYFDGIIVVSQSLLDRIPQTVKKKKPWALIHNAIVMNDYRDQNRRGIMRSQLGIEVDETLLGVVGRLSPEKGCLDMLEAFALLHAERPKTKLLFIGEGPLADPLKEKVGILALDDAVIFAGHCNPVNPYYEAMDVLVCPSHTEGLSNVILEGLCYQLPVVATDVGGNGEIIRNGINGLLIKPKEKRKLKEACLTLIDNRPFASLLGVRGHNIVLNEFDFKARTRKEEKFYASLIRRR